MTRIFLRGHMKINHVDLAPSPAALMESLRDVGYTMETALADIVDNSIAATAKNINLRFAWNSGKPWLAVIDDGEGMSLDELIASMRFGCVSPLQNRTRDDLGRFGLGMKTASFSQCRQLAKELMPQMKNMTTICIELSLPSVNHMAYDHLINVGRPASIILDELRERIEEVDPRSVLLDISSFSRDWLAVILGALCKLPREVSISCCYINASQYGDWLSLGTKEVQSIFGFPGDYFPSQDNVLIILPGFEYDRVESLIYSTEPSRIYMGLPAEGSSFSKVFANRQKELIDRLKICMSAIDILEFEFSASDPEVTKNSILGLIEQAPEFNYAVAPMSTKVSTVGAVLAAISQPSLQLCYVVPLEYNKHSYCKSSDHVWVYQIPR